MGVRTVDLKVDRHMTATEIKARMDSERMPTPEALLAERKWRKEMLDPILDRIRKSLEKTRKTKEEK